MSRVDRQPRVSSNEDAVDESVFQRRHDVEHAVELGDLGVCEGTVATARRPAECGPIIRWACQLTGAAAHLDAVPLAFAERTGNVCVWSGGDQVDVALGADGLGTAPVVVESFESLAADGTLVVWIIALDGSTARSDL